MLLKNAYKQLQDQLYNVKQIKKNKDSRLKRLEHLFKIKKTVKEEN